MIDFTDDIKPNNVLEGYFKIERVLHDTGESLDSYEDHNVIVTSAQSAIIRAIAEPTANSTISKIKLGDDVGTGTVTNPQPAQSSYDSTTMSVVFDAPYTLNIGFNNSITVTFNTTIVGADVMALYPSASSKYFTSAALHTGNGNVFSYKRFPQKSISSVVDINITWSIHY